MIAVNGLAPRRAPSNITPRTRPLKSSENVTEVLEGDCPESDGFFADAEQCDKYYECRDGKVVAEKLCADGTVFNDFSPVHEKCDLPFNIDCSQRPKLREYRSLSTLDNMNNFISIFILKKYM